MSKEKNEQLWITLAFIALGVIVCIINPLIFLILILVYLLFLMMQYEN
ncbi:MAG: hypothetical protein QXS74_06365 [Nitrososphaeria archaeon]